MQSYQRGCARSNNDRCIQHFSLKLHGRHIICRVRFSLAYIFRDAYNLFGRVFRPRRVSRFTKPTRQPKWCLVIGSTTTRSNRKSLMQMDRQENSNAASIKPSALTTLINPDIFGGVGRRRHHRTLQHIAGNGGIRDENHCDIACHKSLSVWRTTNMGSVRRISAHKPVSRLLPFHSIFLGALLAFLLSAFGSFFCRLSSSSSLVYLFFSVTLSSSILSLYIQPVDLTSILRTLPDRVQDNARPVPRWAAPSPSRASGSSCALIQSHHRIRCCDMV